MAAGFLSGFAEFIFRHELIVSFYLLVALLVFIYRKKFQFQLGFIAICRTKIGLGLMDRIASRHRELVKLFGYVAIGAGFISMVFIMFILAKSALTLLTVPGSPSPLAPALPGVRIPGVPESFFVPFVHGILAIFIIAVVHEFAHGVVSRAHNVAVKSSGPAIVGPMFAAFVEPDDEQLKKKSDVVNYSIFAAGSFSNLVLTAILLVFVSMVFVPLAGFLLEKDGVVLSQVTPGAPAYSAGLAQGTVIKAVNGNPVVSTKGIFDQLSHVKPTETVVFSNGTAEFSAVAAVYPGNSSRGFFGIDVAQHYNPDKFPFGIVSWLSELLWWIITLGFGIGLANMIPVGPLDGGKMLRLALARLRGEQKANKAFIRFSLVLLVLILFLLSPIFKAIVKSVVGIF